MHTEKNSEEFIVKNLAFPLVNIRKWFDKDVVTLGYCKCKTKLPMLQYPWNVGYLWFLRNEDSQHLLSWWKNKCT